VTDDALQRREPLNLAGLLVTLGGLVVTGAGFGVFATMAKAPAATATPMGLAILSLAVGVALVELGSWMNAAFYRSLDRSASRPWIEGGGGVALVVGVLVLGNCLALYGLGASATPVVGMVIGLLLIELALVGGHRAVIRTCTSPSFPLTLIVIAAAVLGAVALGLISVINVRHYRRADLTERGTYTLDKRTADMLDNVKKPLRIIGTMVQNPNPAGQEMFNNVIRGRASEMLEEYANHSRFVDYIPLNPYADPEARAKLEAELNLEILRDSVIFEYEGKNKVIEFTELVAQSPFPGMAAPPMFKGEEAFTGALQSLVEGKTTKIYFVVGHGEKDLEEYDRDGISSLAEQVRGDNCDVKPCELPELPDDCDVLVIAGPKKPFAEAEIDALRTYLTEKNGGLIVLLDPAVGETMSSGLESFLRTQGIVVETDQALVAPSSALRLGPRGIEMGWSIEIATTHYGGGMGPMGGPPHAIVRDMKNIRSAFLLACPVSPAAGPAMPGGYGQPPRGDPYASELVKTSERVFAKAGVDPAALDDLRVDDKADRAGPLTIAVARGKTDEQPPPMMRGPMGPPPAGRLVVFGDSDFVTNTYLDRGVTGNGTLFRNSVAWLARKEYKIGIPPRPLHHEHRLDVTGEQKTFARWATVVVPPFHVLVIGVVVWWIRRR